MEHIYIEGALYFLGACVSARFIAEVDFYDNYNTNRLLSHAAILFWPIFTIAGIVVNIFDYYSRD